MLALHASWQSVRAAHRMPLRNCPSKGIAAPARLVASATTLDAEFSTQTDSAQTFDLACPICQDTEFQVETHKASGGQLRCSRCARAFDSGPDYVDLTLTSGLGTSSYTEKNWQGTELFRRSSISNIYERGWRQSFALSGFPGPETEFEYAMNYLRPHWGETLVDMSCGSGLFTRRFAASGKFKNVIAADFSESMLKQTGAFLSENASIDRSKVLLLRADVARLPFKTGSVAAIHAGAAIHCWPNPSAAMAEISRVLKPGGVFVGSTFLQTIAPLGELLGDDRLIQRLSQLDPTNSIISSNYKFWLEPELADLCASVGLQQFERRRQFRFIMFSCTKPLKAAH